MTQGTLHFIARFGKFPCATLTLLLFLGPLTAAQNYTTGTWDSAKFGNHRVLLRVEQAGEAVVARVEWRRRDRDHASKGLLLVDAQTGEMVPDVHLLNISRDRADVLFRPASGAGDYYLYYLPHEVEGRRNYPETRYLAPRNEADSDWLSRIAGRGSTSDGQSLPTAEVVEFQSIDSFNSFHPMEVAALQEEVDRLIESHPDRAFYLFPEDRTNPIRMRTLLPATWIERGLHDFVEFEAARGEFFVFQIGVFAPREQIEGVEVLLEDLRGTDGTVLVAGEEFRCFNLAGRDWTGQEFAKKLAVPAGSIQPLWVGFPIPAQADPGEYLGSLRVGAANAPGQRISLKLTVSNRVLEDSGDHEPWRLSRLRWLDSTIALDDTVVAPFTPVRRSGTELRLLGRRIRLDATGFPSEIDSHFTEQVTEIQEEGRPLLSAPITLTVERAGGTVTSWESEKFEFAYEAQGRVRWESANRQPPLRMELVGDLEFDGTLDFQISVKSEESLPVQDIRLEIPLRAEVARYMLGLGRKGGFRPDRFSWSWDRTRNQDSVWIGNVNAGLQVSLSDLNYVRPLNTNFYQLKPLNLPPSWWNGGRGGIQLEDRGESYSILCFSGPRRIEAGETLHFNFRLMVTPFKPLDTDEHWKYRFYHRYAPIEEIAAAGANTINVHHANEINPFINYPFLRVPEMKAYVDEAHGRGMKVKIYYTVRELTNRAPELFPLLSLGDEVLSNGPGGGPPWLCEHVDSGYIAGWYVPELQDAALITSGTSRWHNYYLEGLDWLVRNVGIDGIYIDDVAFDRTVMKRLRRILDKGRPGALIDLHSANQFNPRDGFANSANLYMEHFPYIDRLWFGEYFDYDSAPDFWLVEVSGIPFGLMGEMLEKGGNPWRGMIYGMTSRLPWAGDPRPIWRLWDEFGIEKSRMIGYWSRSCPVRLGHPDLRATVYQRESSALVVVASWSRDTVEAGLEINWPALGLDPDRVRVWAPEVEGLQKAADYGSSPSIPIDPGGGCFLILEQ